MCEICRSPNVIYPFQLDETYQVLCVCMCMDVSVNECVYLCATRVCVVVTNTMT